MPMCSRISPRECNGTAVEEQRTFKQVVVPIRVLSQPEFPHARLQASAQHDWKLARCVIADQCVSEIEKNGSKFHVAVSSGLTLA